MTGKWTDDFSFVTGAVRSSGAGLLAAVSDDAVEARTNHTFFLIWENGEWDGLEAPKPWGTVGMCVCEHPRRETIALGSGGQVLCVGDGDVHEEMIEPGGDPPGERPTMRGIRCIDGKAYAVGMNRRAYRRDDANKWVSIDQGARPPSDSRAVVGFEAVDGFTQSDIYAVGWDGEIWHFDGARWTQVDSPTNVVFSDVCCAEDGFTYACARAGIIVRGRGNEWQIIDHQLSGTDFWGAAWYDGKLYLSTTKELFTLQDDNLNPVAFGTDSPGSCFHLSAGHGVLWSIGAKDVMVFDGQNWTRID